MFFLLTTAGESKIHLVWHRIDTSMSSRPSASVSSRWRPKPEMTRHPRSMPAGLKNDVNSMRSVELNNNGLIQKQPKISMLNTRLSCFELTSSPDQSVVINRTYSGFHSFQIYRWRKKKTALLTSEVSFAAVFWHFTQHSLGERCLTCQKTAEKEASYLWIYLYQKNNSLCTFDYSSLTLNYVPMLSNHYFLSCN